MSGDEINPIDAAIEMSDEELDEVAGGLNLSFTGAFFRKTNVAAIQETQAGPGGSSTKSAFEMQNIESAAFQVTILDASAEDLEFLSGILGSAKTIDGSA